MTEAHLHCIQLHYTT